MPSDKYYWPHFTIALTILSGNGYSTFNDSKCFTTESKKNMQHLNTHKKQWHKNTLLNRLIHGKHSKTYTPTHRIMPCKNFHRLFE